ncbi:MAG: leucyl/phenylalanyl-tRNA--protein transferase [Polyangiaceae bacterium]
MDCSVDRLLEAYRFGIFPWPAAPEVVPWCSPPERAIFPMTEPLHWSRSLIRSMKKKPFEVTLDRAFEQVIDACGHREGGTWITPSLREGFLELHRQGWAHSLEVWNTHSRKLVGGIYGIAMGGFFAGESMFHHETDASKVAFASLITRLKNAGYELFDAQILTSHLSSLGCVAVSREEYLLRLERALLLEREFPLEPPRESTKSESSTRAPSSSAPSIEAS